MRRLENHSSPGWIKNLLLRILDEKIAEASLGDLEEKFQQRVHNNMSHWRAVLLYILEALGFLRMTRVSGDSSMQTNINMVNHTLVFFTRLVGRDSGYYLVSILGLALSLVSFLLIMMFIRDELSYDKFHAQNNHLYRVNTHLRLSEVEYNLANTAFPAAKAIESEIEGVKYAVRIFPQELVLEYGDKKLAERAVFADEKFFEVFTFPFLEGDKKMAMSNPASVILTQKAAVRYFGLDKAIGKTIKLQDQTVEVTGVIRDVPEQSHMKKFSQKVFVYEYLDKSLDKLYTNETKLSEMMVFFTVIALYLTCYGMFAMSSLLFRSRLREVAIRKVFGANHFIIMRQFYGRYAAFNILAIALSLPVAVYLGDLWLQTFPYHINLTSTFFIKAGVFILVAGLLSVSFYMIKIAYSNPVKFLRRE